MEKDVGSVPKNPETEIIVRIDDFGGRVGVTIREFVKSERYTGFTKAGTRISAENFPAFKKLIESIDEKELAKIAAATSASTGSQSSLPEKSSGKSSAKPARKPTSEDEMEF